MSEPDDLKRFSPSSERNKEPILDILRGILPSFGLVLEVACGTGQHAVHFAERLPGVIWQPTDIDEHARASAEAWRAESGLKNIEPPLHLDTTSTTWPVEQAAAIVNCNMIHISPWEVCLGLLDGAARILPDDGILFMYGPYKVGGTHTAPSNEAFDQSLRSQDPSWGIRNLDDVALEARRRGLHLVKTVKMPANNFSVIYKKTPMMDIE